MRLKDFFLRQNEQEEPVSIDSCPKAKKVLSRYGYQIVSPEDLEEPEYKPSSDPYCENARKVASKYGVVITCPE